MCEVPGDTLRASPTLDCVEKPHHVNSQKTMATWLASGCSILDRLWEEFDFSCGYISARLSGYQMLQDQISIIANLIIRIRSVIHQD